MWAVPGRDCGSILSSRMPATILDEGRRFVTEQASLSCHAFISLLLRYHGRAEHGAAAQFPRARRICQAAYSMRTLVRIKLRGAAGNFTEGPDVSGAPAGMTVDSTHETMSVEVSTA